jgi:hypothetical protein
MPQKYLTGFGVRRNFVIREKEGLSESKEPGSTPKRATKIRSWMNQNVFSNEQRVGKSSEFAA